MRRFAGALIFIHSCIFQYPFLYICICCRFPLGRFIQRHDIHLYFAVENRNWLSLQKTERDNRKPFAKNSLLQSIRLKDIPPTDISVRPLFRKDHHLGRVVSRFSRNPSRRFVQSRRNAVAKNSRGNPGMNTTLQGLYHLIIY